MEQGHLGFQFLPYPATEIFQRRQFKARDFIQNVMIKHVVDCVQGFIDILETHQPAGCGIGRAAQKDFDLERVTMHARKAMIVMRIGRQVMRGIEAKFFKYLDHNGPCSGYRHFGAAALPRNPIQFIVLK